jgi:uncharacterized protein (DUF952 family)
VTNPDDAQDPICHLALETEWQEAVERREPYGRSTLGRSQAEVGFIHCSFASQVETIARLVYRGRGDVLLLVIDPSRVDSEIRIENLDGENDRFPHIYGRLPIAAVVRVATIPIREDGAPDLKGLVPQHGRVTLDMGHTMYLSDPFDLANYEGLRLGDSFLRGGESFGVHTRVRDETVSNLRKADVVEQATFSKGQR